MLVLILVPLVQLPGVRGQAGVPAGAASVQVRYIVILSGRGITRGLIVAGHPRHVSAEFKCACVVVAGTTVGGEQTKLS